jgi:hypothetical protein
MVYEDTHRLILQNKFDRIEHLVQINHQSTLAVPAVLAMIWGVEGGLENFQNARILCVISIGLLLIWRCFAHYIDDDIAKNYVDIVKIEETLGVSPHISLYENIIDSLTNVKKCQKNTYQFNSLNQTLKKLCSNHKIRLFECLYEKQKMGSRGHDMLDVLALGFIFICSSTMILGLQFIYTWMIFFILFSFLVLIMWVLGNIWLMTGFSILFSLFLLPVLIPLILSIGIGMVFSLLLKNIIQKDPSHEDIREILLEIGCSFDPFP